ncbi:MAG: alanine--tRNA ligase [Candidatus Pacebacteria bacterium]|nr:alanine--tRNA ligase [Candidatus Paceibacterota bacterium]
MDSEELRQKFLAFFEKRGHLIVPSSSLLPSDSSVLFTTAGMQQFSSYLAGKKDIIKDFGSRHLASCQKCFRTDDIDEVGDDTHHTFFEMLGNWSIGEDEKGYFKQGAIDYALEFLVGELGLDKTRLWVTVFKGEGSIKKDEEAVSIWEEKGIPLDRIKEFGKKDNFWGPVGEIGPCGPCSEIYYDRGEGFGCGRPDCGPNCDYCKRFVEIWNLVFMEYFRNEKGEYEILPQRNIDTGIGFERLASLLQKKDSAYESDILSSIVSELEEISGLKYFENKKAFRVIADHVRGAVFLASEGIVPSNVSQGYVLRRILRRIIRYARMLGMNKEFLIPLIDLVIDKYKGVYPEVLNKREEIVKAVKDEELKFGKTLQAGLEALKKFYKKTFGMDPDEANARGLIIEDNRLRVNGIDVYRIYETYGFPPELSQEIMTEWGLRFDDQTMKEAEEERERHQEVSRAGAEKKFGGVGKEGGEQEAKLHTATHLLHSALRNVLGEHVQQMGSDITFERLRFDFKHPQKLTEEEKKKIQELVNKKIKQEMEVKKEEMALAQALESGALAFFKEKYPETVFVWTIFDPETGEVFSKEICAGPHVQNLKDLGNFEIIKEESSSAGIRRIKAVLK